MGIPLQVVDLLALVILGLLCGLGLILVGATLVTLGRWCRGGPPKPHKPPDDPQCWQSETWVLRDGRFVKQGKKTVR
ncbi:MAG: hypothetical protein IRY99_08395 [Isosphaeraceae bacterium]|nr:hypothetical protein [Isosphaeraceae bacterium]